MLPMLKSVQHNSDMKIIKSTLHGRNTYCKSLPHNYPPKFNWLTLFSCKSCWINIRYDWYEVEGACISGNLPQSSLSDWEEVLWQLCAAIQQQTERQKFHSISCTQSIVCLISKDWEEILSSCKSHTHSARAIVLPYIMAHHQLNLVSTCWGHKEREDRRNKILKLANGSKETPDEKLRILMKKGPVSIN